MSRNIKRIISLALVLVMACAAAAFAGAATVVSPAANSISYSASLLVSVKVTEPKTVKIAVFEEKLPSSSAKDAPLVSVDAAEFTTADLEALSDLYNGTAATPATLSNGSTAAKYANETSLLSASYTNVKEIGVYTKQISNVTPGLYRVQVDTLASDGSVAESKTSFLAVKEKTDEKKNTILENQQTGAMQFLQGVLKSIFK